MPITILGLLREGEFFSPFILSYYVLLLLGVIPHAPVIGCLVIA